jgi:hypothetical protein
MHHKAGLTPNMKRESVMPRATATVVFLDLGATGLPDLAQQLCAASVALPDRRPFCQMKLAQFAAGSWHVAEGALADLLKTAPGRFHFVGFIPPATGLIGPAPLAGLADWQNRLKALLNLAAPNLYLVPTDFVEAEPEAVLAQISARVGQRIALPESAFARPPCAAQTPLQALLAGLALRQNPKARALMATLYDTASASPLADVSALDQAAGAVLQAEADLRQRLLEQGLRRREVEIAAQESESLLQDQIAAMHKLAETQQAELYTLRAEKDAALERVNALLSSTSWRVTAPLRRLRGGR